MKRSRIALFVMLAIFAVMLMGATASAEKVEIEFWTFWGSETRRPIVEHIVNEFNASQDRIVVKHVYNPWGDIWTKSLAAVAAGNPPQVVVNDINNVALRASKKQAMDLTSFIGEDNIKDDFFPELWKTVEWNGGVYGVPFNTDTRFLFYNKDHFREVGLDPERPPQTWAELEEYAAKLDKIDGRRVERIGFYPLFGNFGRDTWMITGDNGVSWLDNDGNPKINTENKINTLQWLMDWRDKYGARTIDAFQAEFGSQASDPLISGKLSMMVNIATHYTQIRDYAPEGSNFGYALVPEKEPGTGSWSWGGGFVLEIPYGAKHAAEAYEFIRYATGPEAQRHWAVLNFDNVANIEGSNLAASDPRLSPEAQNVYSLAVENMKWTIMTPVPYNLAGYLDLINPQLDAALLGQKSAKDALDQAQRDVEVFIAKAQ